MKLPPSESGSHNGHAKRLLASLTSRLLDDVDPFSIDITGPYNSRPETDERHARSLGEDMVRNGNLERVKLIEVNGEKHDFDGRHRILGARMFGLKLRAEVFSGEFSPESMKLVSLILGLKRKNLSSFDLALSARSLKLDHGLGETEIGAALGRSQESVSVLINSLRLPPRALELYRGNKLPLTYVSNLRKAPWDQIDGLADRVVAGEFQNRDELAREVERMRRPGRKEKKPVELKEKEGDFVCRMTMPPVPFEQALEGAKLVFAKWLKKFAKGRELPPEAWKFLTGDG